MTEWSLRNGRQSPGRPVALWVDGIAKIGGTTWIRAAQDQANWRKGKEVQSAVGITGLMMMMVTCRHSRISVGGYFRLFYSPLDNYSYYSSRVE